MQNNFSLRCRRQPLKEQIRGARLLSQRRHTRQLRMRMALAGVSVNHYDGTHVYIELSPFQPLTMFYIWRHQHLYVTVIFVQHIRSICRKSAWVLFIVGKAQTLLFLLCEQLSCFWTVCFCITFLLNVAVFLPTFRDHGHLLNKGTCKSEPCKLWLRKWALYMHLYMYSKFCSMTHTLYPYSEPAHTLHSQLFLPYGGT